MSGPGHAADSPTNSPNSVADIVAALHLKGEDDIAAAVLLTEIHPHSLDVHVICNPAYCTAAAKADGLRGGLRSWTVVSESTPGKTYTVEERADSRYGGTYIHCTCPQWGIQKGKGRDCKHVIEIRWKFGIPLSV